MIASIVLGLQFGDEGKGRTVDYLSTLSTNYNPIVVRFSGGQNCGHTVFKDGIKHIFSSFGSATMRNVPTYVTEHCTVYLNSVYTERKLLISKGFTPQLYVNPLAMITTPYDVAYNRIMSDINKHGSCGVGISTTMKRHLETGYKLYVKDLKYPKILVAKLDKIKNYYDDLVKHDSVLHQSYHHLLNGNEDLFYSLITEKLFEIKEYDFLNKFGNLIFEGSQGIMLDMDHGIFPNVTYANTTSKNAIEICKILNIEFVKIYYVTRCYQTRHGNGWMSNQDDISLINNEEEINVLNYQGEFRKGEFDYDILNYSLESDDYYHKNGSISVSKILVITCLDQRPDFQFDRCKIDGRISNVIKFGSPENIYLSINN